MPVNLGLRRFLDAGTLRGPHFSKAIFPFFMFPDLPLLAVFDA
jgi:hypothetical protein